MRFDTALFRTLMAVGALSLAACSSDDDVKPPKDPNFPSDPQDGTADPYNQSNGSGSCSFEPNPEDLLIASLNDTQFPGSKVCGACAEVTNKATNAQITVRIVDSCNPPECTPGHLRLRPEAFAQVAPQGAAQANISWRLVPCTVEGPLRYHFQNGSSQYWTAIQVRNHRLPIKKFEYWKNGAWVEVERTDYNYFLDTQGMGPGELSVRVTAVDGQELEDIIPRIEAGMVFDGAAQFE